MLLTLRLRTDRSANRKFGILSVLKSTRSFQATDPRDKPFGVLGVSLEAARGEALPNAISRSFPSMLFSYQISVGVMKRIEGATC